MSDPGLTLRQAALWAGFGLLAMMIAAPFAEFAVYGRLVVPDDPGATVLNIQDHTGLYVAGLFGYLIVFILDVIVAWALYFLLAPVNRPLSLLTAWVRLVYTAIALFSMLKLVGVFRWLEAPASDRLPAQVKLLLDGFRYEWGFALILLGWLVYRSGYIPKFIGVLLVPISGEVVFMLWLVIRGRKIIEPRAA